MALFVYTLALLGLGWLLWTVGAERLGLPRAQLSAWTQWIETAGPLTIALSLARAACLVAIAYLLVCVALSLVAAITKSALLETLASRVAGKGVFNMARLALGASAVVLLAGPANAAQATSSQTGVTQKIAVEGVADYSAPMLHHIDPAQIETAPTETAQAETIQTETPQEVPDELTVIDLRDTHEVAPGESLWVIARGTLLEQDPTVTNTDIANYVNRIIDLNDVKTPNLIHPGQHLKLPQ